MQKSRPSPSRRTARSGLVLRGTYACGAATTGDAAGATGVTCVLTYAAMTAATATLTVLTASTETWWTPNATSTVPAAGRRPVSAGTWKGWTLTATIRAPRAAAPASMPPAGLALSAVPRAMVRATTAWRTATMRAGSDHVDLFMGVPLGSRAGD